MNKVDENIERGIAIRKEIRGKIVGYIQEHGYSPTVREIGDMVGLKSTSSVQSHLNRMFQEGMLETDCKAGTPRAIRVPGYQFVKAVNTEKMLEKMMENKQMAAVQEKKKWEPCSLEVGDINELHRPTED